MLILFRRHLTNCRHRPKGRKHRHCGCPLWVQGTLKGERIRRSLDIRSWEAGQDLLREWESRGPKSVLVTVAGAAKRFFEDAKARNLADATVGKYKVLLSRLEAYANEIGVKYISQLDPEDVMKFRASWPDAPISASKKLERLRAFFRFCTAMKWVEANPVAGLRSPRVPVRPTLPFTGEEFAAILEAVDRYPTKNSFGFDNRARLRAFVLLLRYSGLRIRDAVMLRRDRVNDGKLFLYTQKTGQPVWMPLPQVVLDALDGAQGELLFWTGRGLPKSAVADWQRSLRRLFKLAGVEDAHAHRFRDTFSVELLKKGVPLETVAVLLGNTVKIAEKHYAPWVESRQVLLEAAVRSAWT